MSKKEEDSNDVGELEFVEVSTTDLRWVVYKRGTPEETRQLQQRIVITSIDELGIATDSRDTWRAIETFYQEE